MDLPVRLRRLRKSRSLRRLAQETLLPTDQLIMPAFVIPGTNREESISSMPGVSRRSVDELREWASGLRVKALLLFGVPNREEKDSEGSAAADEEGLVPTAVSILKEERPDLTVITDVCLCAYTSHGQCGIVTYNNRVDNDRTLEVLSKMATAHAAAGADMVSPSAMADGQVRAIRSALDKAGYQNVGIMPCSSKMASALYRPMREALQFSPSSGDRNEYQSPPPNQREALRESLLDEEEGADWLMVKPATSCLDIVSELRRRTLCPIAAFHSSGEYAMLKAAAETGALEEIPTVMENVLSIKRAGADAIVTYYAEKICQWSNG